MQQVKEVARKWQDAGRSNRDAAAAGTQQQDETAAGRSVVALKFKECLDAQLCKFLSEFKNLH
jgi:hypothetical protein